MTQPTSRPGQHHGQDPYQGPGAQQGPRLYEGQGPYQGQGSGAGRPAPGMQTPGVPGGDPEPPIRAATALVVVAALSALGQVIGTVAGFVPGSVLGLDRGTGVLIAVGIATIVLAIASFALWIASMLLSILVIVKGRGLLRRGGVILLVPVVLGMLFGLEVSGDPSMFADGLLLLLRVLSILGDVAELALTLTGIGVLVAGLRALRRPDGRAATA